MLLIKKHPFSQEIASNISDIKRTSNWDAIGENDTDRKRNAFDMLDKDKIREHLIKEQHGICAYCMKRIRNDGILTTIDHRVPLQDNGKDQVFDYRNLYATCKGGQDLSEKNKLMSCEALKKDRGMKIDPSNELQINHIRYERGGKIKTDPKDEDMEYDINAVLGLNGECDVDGKIIRDTSTGLVKGRKDMYKKYESYIKGLEKRHKLKKSTIEKRIREIEDKDTYDEFEGVMLYFLKRKIHQLV